jgi:hypothetical protein
MKFQKLMFWAVADSFENKILIIKFLAFADSLENEISEIIVLGRCSFI